MTALKNLPSTKNPYINTNLGARKNKPAPTLASQDYLKNRLKKQVIEKMQKQ